MTAKISFGLLALGLAVAGCESLLDVENPNNIKGDDIRNPTAAAALVNGVHSAVARGVNAVVLPAATASDELDWVGSRDAWRQLDDGTLSDPFNEFTDAAFPNLAQARWLADEAVEVLEEHRTEGRLVPGNVEPLLLARAYLYAGIAYTTIGDLFDRWAFSDMRTPAAPLAAADMRQLYDSAIVFLDRGLTVAEAEVTRGNTGAAPWRLAILGMRARAKHGRAIWNMIGPVPDAPANITNNGLVSDAGAVADANQAIALAAADWKFEFKYSSTTVGGDFGAWVNDRLEMRLGDVYVYGSASNKTWDSTRILDPFARDTIITVINPTTNDTVIRPKRDPVLNATATAFKSAATYPVFTVTSARELRLIVAEAALLAGDTATFATHVNAVRALNSLATWNQAAPQLPARDLLIYERQVNLYLQGRRLADQYRFGIPAGKWQPGSEALTQTGRMLPITARECLSNPLIGGENCQQ